jgi:hypothetical protein
MFRPFVASTMSRCTHALAVQQFDGVELDFTPINHKFMVRENRGIATGD